MATQASQEAAAKERIIKHMNQDHHDSIIRYLEHYRRMPSWDAYNGRISGIDLDGITFSFTNDKEKDRIHHIPFKPPMTSLREARERLVAMDAECVRGLGKSDITVKEFVPPTGLSALIFCIVAATFVGYSQRWWFQVGGPVYALLGGAFSEFSYGIQPWVFWGMVLIHGAELVWFVKGKLRVHSVNVRESVWWKWAFFTFVEGQFAFKRFDALVEKKRLEKEKQKH